MYSGAVWTPSPNNNAVTGSVNAYGPSGQQTQGWRTVHWPKDVSVLKQAFDAFKTANPAVTDYRQMILNIEKWTSVIRLTNPSKYPVRATFYLCKARNDYPFFGNVTSITTGPANCAINIPTDDPVSQLVAMVTQEGKGNDGIVFCPGVSPFDCSAFCTLFKVVKTKHVRISAHRNQTFKFKIQPQSLKGIRYFGSSGLTTYTLRENDMFLVCRLVGETGLTDTQDGSSQLTSTIPPAELSFQSMHRICYSFANTTQVDTVTMTRPARFPFFFAGAGAGTSTPALPAITDTHSRVEAVEVVQTIAQQTGAVTRIQNTG